MGVCKNAPIGWIIYVTIAIFPPSKLSDWIKLLKSQCHEHYCKGDRRNLMANMLKGARAQKIGLKSTYLKIWFR